MGKKIKVSTIIYSDFPVHGGYENLVYDLVGNLSLNVKVQVICLNMTNNRPIPKYVEVFPILTKMNIKYIGFLLSMIWNMFKFLQYLLKERPDVINAHPSFPAGFIALIPAKILKIPLICTSHGGDIQINNATNYGVRLNKIAAFLLRITLNGTDAHVLVSETMINAAEESGSDISKIYIIHNGIQINSKKINQQFLNKYNIKNSDITILFLSRLNKLKRPEDLLRAFCIADNTIQNLKLVIAGKGEDRTILEKLVSNLNLRDKVIFTGFLYPDNGKWDLLKRCDIFVLPSLIEGLPISILEAMSCGKPIIATNISPFKDIIKNRETGILVDPKSPEKISEAIIMLALNKEKRFNMGELAKKEFNKKFTIQKVSEEYLKLYKRIILERSR